MLGLIIQIISLICIVLFRLRLLRQINHKLGASVFFRCSIYALISVGCIAGLARTRIHIPMIYSSLLFILSITIIGVFIWKRAMLSLLPQSLLLIALQYTTPSITQSITNVWSEESLKQSSLQGGGTQSIFSDNNNLFLLGCVSAIVFGGVENILFFIKAQNSGGIVMIDYIIQRSLIPLLIHIASVCITIAIGYTFYRHFSPTEENKETSGGKWLSSLSSPFSLFIASIGGIIFHSIYNFSLSYQVWIMVPILCIASIAIISYGLFRSDLLYTNGS